jgi:hypothetical protein
MKLAFILCISLVYLGYVNAALLGGWGNEETATSEIQGYVNRVNFNISTYKVTLASGNPCPKAFYYKSK